MDASPKRIPKFLAFLKSPKYFNDNTLNELKNKAAIHLKLTYILFGGGAILLIIVYVVLGFMRLQ